MRVLLWLLPLALLSLALFTAPNYARADDDDDTDMEDIDAPAPGATLNAGADTDAGVVEKEEQSMKYDGLTAEETDKIRENAESHTFQAEVSRMMKLIINSLYKNKEIFLRELISNASDALDKIRFLALKDQSALGELTDLTIKIHVDKENKVLHITDTGVGMTKDDLIKNLGTIAKSGTSEFLAAAGDGTTDTSNLIGQFGVGFYSAFLVADTVVVTSKNNNDDKQYIWESNAESFTIMEDTRPDQQLGRGTRVSLYLKEEAAEFLETDTIRGLIAKYSEFINFDIFLYSSKIIQVDEEVEDAADEDDEVAADEAADSEDEAVEEGDDEDVEEETATETKKVDKTVWDWEIMNANKPIWTRATADVEDDEYNNFFKAFSKESVNPLGHIHFTAEGEVTFRSILYIPGSAPKNLFTDYGKTAANIKMYVRRVFITDDFADMMPKYLSFIQGIVDSDDLPLNVSRETLQQHKLLKVIKKKLVRKSLEMIKKLKPEEYKTFWKEYGTSIKLGLIEDFSNRSRLAKLLRFASSNDTEEMTSLESYVERMKKDQSSIFFIAATTRAEAEKSPFVERLHKRGFEVLYMTEPVDEYTVQNLPEFEGKKFQNVAKEGLTFGDESEAEKERAEAEAAEFEPLTKWLGETLSDSIDKAVVSSRLLDSPCALVASSYGWSGNMERIMKSQAYAKQDDPSTSYYATQKKTLEINARHPVIKALLERVQVDDDKAADEEADATTENMARVLVDTARLRSGYTLDASEVFAERIEKMLRLSMGVDMAAVVEAVPEDEPKPESQEGDDEEGDEEEEEEEVVAEEAAPAAAETAEAEAEEEAPAKDEL